MATGRICLKQLAKPLMAPIAQCHGTCTEVGEPELHLNSLSLAQRRQASPVSLFPQHPCFGKQSLCRQSLHILVHELGCILPSVIKALFVTMCKLGENIAVRMKAYRIPRREKSQTSEWPTESYSLQLELSCVSFYCRALIAIIDQHS